MTKQTSRQLVFTRLLLLFAFLAVFASTATWAQEVNPALVSTNRNVDRYKKHLEILEQGNVDILWVGDSITRRWEEDGKFVWAERYEARHAMNFGISGDFTGHVIWRLDNSPMNKIAPKICILLIGTNNLGLRKPGTNESLCTPAQTVEGIQAIVDKLRAIYPKAKIVLMEVFPRGASPDDPLRVSVNKINEILRPIYGDDKVENVSLVSIGDKFLKEDGTLPKELMSDYLHPTDAGYRIWADAVEPFITEALEKGAEDNSESK